MTERAYPLAWPAGWPRNKDPQRSKFEVTFDKARRELGLEIERLGGRYPVISTNAPLRRDGAPYSNPGPIRDFGVAVYFERKGKQMVFACDRWDSIKDNMRAISKTIEAIRGIERWGASDLMERSLAAFTALPPRRSCWEILGVSSKSSKDEVRAAHRSKAKTAHPDAGGSDAAMAELNRARDEALELAY